MFQQTLQEITLSYIWVPGTEGLFPSEVKTPAPGPSSLPKAAGLYIVQT